MIGAVGRATMAEFVVALVRPWVGGGRPPPDAGQRRPTTVVPLSSNGHAWRTGEMHQASAGHAKACGGMVGTACWTGGRRRKPDWKPRRLSSFHWRTMSWRRVSCWVLAIWRVRWPSRPPHGDTPKDWSEDRRCKIADPGAVAATTRHRKRHRGLAHVKCGFGDREDPGSSSNTKHLFAGGVHRGASRFPLPARSAVGALRHPETDRDSAVKAELPTSSVASMPRYLRVVVPIWRVPSNRTACWRTIRSRNRTPPASEGDPLAVEAGMAA